MIEENIESLEQDVDSLRRKIGTLSDILVSRGHTERCLDKIIIPIYNLTNKPIKINDLRKCSEFELNTLMHYEVRHGVRKKIKKVLEEKKSRKSYYIPSVYPRPGVYERQNCTCGWVNLIDFINNR